MDEVMDVPDMAAEIYQLRQREEQLFKALEIARSALFECWHSASAAKARAEINEIIDQMDMGA